ncbi:prepilin-type N-terminal cleavage/methylation domain-containing protein [Lichenifustis flavocetrariae]|uniref:Prepilin-type N-terminal cleavage/methylation domain-containing protein n=1 Tax=Lichenifustis flavocetrariae TaxID=2949735 RepID=A0AA41Z1L5_9HYPH|nr:prepilin-type N-terminal cleavage/methylation domain-containing protein [Lichenifustis flavocetrariae]MCW6508828.1 prepilin-type N-terminal cleavage/methylation domain-containing protein [Lichenifustis flavocetrariae]
MPVLEPRLNAGGSRHDHDGKNAGFTLFEVLLGLLLMALIAALVLPGPQRPTGPAALRTAANEVSALLRNTRTAAIGSGRPTRASIEPASNRVQSPVLGTQVEVPAGVSVALLDRSNQIIDFAPNGTSSGGNILLQGPVSRVVIAINADTGAIRLALP